MEKWNYWRLKQLQLIKDPIIEKIIVLYELGEEGQYEIIRRTISIFIPLLRIGWSSKRMV